MGILDTQHINNELDTFGDTVTVRAVTKLDYDVRGNAQEVLGDTKVSYLTGEDSNTACYDAAYVAQTFLVGSSDIDIISIKVKVKRTGTPGAITIGVYAIDANSKPTGSALTSGSLDYTDLIADAGTEWIVLPLTSHTLSANTTYAIVISVTGGDASNKYDIRTVTTGAYASGNILTSADSGTSWTAGSGDIVFDLYGDTEATAMVDVLTQEDDVVASGQFQSGDKRFTFKNSESNIDRGTRVYHDSKWYEIDSLVEDSSGDTTYWIQVIAKKV